MKKVIFGLVVIILLVAFGWFWGCHQSCVRSYGGSMAVNLEPGQKLELVTWKINSLWVLTRPMRAGETPETHVFREDSVYGMMEGKVTIVERAAEPK